MTRDPHGIPEDPDPGAPIDELAGYGIPTSDSFVEVVQARLDARERGLQAAEFSLGGLSVVACAYFFLFLQLVSPQDGSGE